MLWSRPFETFQSAWNAFCDGAAVFGGMTPAIARKHPFPPCPEPSIMLGVVLDAWRDARAAADPYAPDPAPIRFKSDGPVWITEYGQGRTTISLTAAQRPNGWDFWLAVEGPCEAFDSLAARVRAAGGDMRELPCPECGETRKTEEPVLGTGPVGGPTDSRLRCSECGHDFE